MSTLGYFFILGALVIMRQIYKGRMLNIGEDLSDAFLAIVSGDSTKISEVFSRTGDANLPSASEPSATETTSKAVAGVIAKTAPILAFARKRGAAAKGYRWAATGPDYYDCSGLIYRAAQDAGYRGPRFTTATVLAMPGFKKISGPNVEGPGISNAGLGDIVLWLTGMGGGGHMGVISGENTFYSALNPQEGIKDEKLSTFRKVQPIYVRFRK